MISQLFGVEETLRDLAILGGPRLTRAIVNGVRRGARRIQKEAILGLRSFGVGRTIWGRKASGAKKAISLGRARTTATGVELDLTAKGLAAMQEAGGRTEAHSIRARRVKALALSDGRFFKSVKHPGSNIAVKPSLEPALRSGAESIATEVRAGIDALIAQVNR